MSWTSPADLRLQVQKLWDGGELLAACMDEAFPQDSLMGVTLATKLTFPKRLRLSGPTSDELSAQFDVAKAWVAQLQGVTTHLRIVQREFRHRVLGVNKVPDEIWLDTLDDALALLGKKKEARLFVQQVKLTSTHFVQLLPWLKKRPLTALALGDDWPRLLAVVAWLRAHPRPGIYLRQVNIPGIDSKFIEQYRHVLAQLLDLSLPAQAIENAAVGAAQFCARYGFRDKPLRIRFRLLDPRLGFFSCTGAQHAGAQDVQITQQAFAQLALKLQRVFITENEVNFLAFPLVPGSMVIFGGGYGFEALGTAPWLHACPVHYWGDIDTHGFAILDQLRAQLPHAQSFLMDRNTLMAHTAHWGQEPEPQLRDLQRLSQDEQAMLDDLRHHRLKERLRLEQERIGYGWVLQALKEMCC